MKPNLFIALEGIDGSGKSTQSKLLANRLEQAGHKVYTTFEPTDRPIGKMIRSVLKGELQMDERVIAGLFVADRLDHLLNADDGIIQKLRDGFTVITDRYYFSSYAYHGTHLPMDWVIQGNAMAAELLRPDLNIYIDISANASMERINKNRNSTELYETAENLNNVRTNYFKAFELLKTDEKVAIIDGQKSPEVIAEDIWKKITELA